MAKSHRSRTLQNSIQQTLKRDILIPIAKPRLLSISKPLTDNRLYRPEQTIKREALLRKITTLRAFKPSNQYKNSLQALSIAPDVQQIRRATCIRRSIRQRVLHALKKTGRGSGQKPHKITWKSRVKCS